MSGADAVRFYAATDVGRVRAHNEDNFLVDKKLCLFVVADGMGGHAAGEVASAIAVRTVHDEIKAEKELIEQFLSPRSSPNRATVKDILALVEHAVQRACSKIHEEARADPSKRGMGTTLSLVLLLDSRAFIGHVGDSRIYLRRAGAVQQITEDHTVFNELIKRGKLTREQIERVAQKNAITRAVGIYERVEVDTLVMEVLPGDTFLLASDGLTGYVESLEELSEHLERDGEIAVRSLIALALERGGRDNVTVVIVKLGEDGAEDIARAKRLSLKREVLARMPLFARLTDRELLRVMQSIEVRSFPAGATIMREGERGDELLVVLTGTVRVSRGEAQLNILGPGEHVGEMALIRSAPRSASVTALEATELIAIRRTDFFEILRKEHEIAVKMLWQFLGVLADRLDYSNAELHHAKRELVAEDVTSDIFPDLDDSRGPDTDREGG